MASGYGILLCCSLMFGVVLSMPDCFPESMQGRWQERYAKATINADNIVSVGEGIASGITLDTKCLAKSGDYYLMSNSWMTYCMLLPEPGPGSDTMKVELKKMLSKSDMDKLLKTWEKPCKAKKGAIERMTLTKL